MIDTQEISLGPDSFVNGLDATLYYNDPNDPSKGSYIGSIFDRDSEEKLPGIDPETGERLVGDVAGILNPDSGKRDWFVVTTDAHFLTFQEYKELLAKRRDSASASVSEEKSATEWGDLDSIKVTAGIRAVLGDLRAEYEARLPINEALDVASTLNAIIEQGLADSLDRKKIERLVAKQFHPDMNPNIDQNTAHQRALFARALLDKTARIPKH